MPPKKGANVEQVKELLSQLDYYKYTKHDSAKIEEIEAELAQIRHSFPASPPKTDDGYVPYPDPSDEHFFEKIFKKKEFHKNVYAPIDNAIPFDQHASERCGSDFFRLSKNQVFLKNFISPHTGYKGILLFHGVGVGKCHAKNTPIIMYDGTVKMVQDIKEGDLIMGDDSTPRRILNTIRGTDEMFKITPIKGTPYVVNSEHILCLRYTGKGAIEKVTKKNTDMTWYKAIHLDNKTLGTISKNFATHQEAESYLESFSLEDKIVEVPVKKYLELSQKLQKNLKGYRASAINFPTPTTPITIEAYQLGDAISSKQPSTNSIFKGQGKHIPLEYKCGSIETRLELLAGLIDADGYGIHNCCKIIVRSQRLVDDILFVARSLGFAAYITYLEPIKGRRIHTWYVNISGNGLHNIPVRKQDKKMHERQQIKDALVTGIKVTSEGHGEYFGFTTDKNHRYLLGDFTVTHNSCSAISIAEQFKNVFDNRVLLLAPTSIKENFRKQIFDINKVQQCTGTKYLAQIPDRNIITKQTLERRINKLINDNYEVMGFQEFARSVEKLKIAYKERKQESKYRKRLREIYSNRVIIIDEVHNVRKGDKESKLVPPFLMEVIKNGENIRLVLLTATPMFNEASEIVWLLNMLLANDRRPLLQDRHIFDANRRLTPKGRKMLEEAARGYVSYMRGENPFSFPFRLNPSDNKDKNIMKKIPQHDIKGEPIDEEFQLGELELIESKMSSYHRSLYEAAEEASQESKRRAEDDSDSDDSDSDIDDDDVMVKTMNTKLVQISNAVFPALEDDPDFQDCYGRNGMRRCFDRAANDRKLYKLSYKDEIKKAHGEFFSEAKLNEYAPKIKRIVDYIKNSRGIVFVYSFYKESGIIPLALALEHAGFTKYNNNNILQRITTKSKPFLVNGKQATYSILTPDKEYTPDFDGEIEVIRSQANKNGELVKVILGTSVSSEGLDFKNIREIHLLEPWYHLNKVAQIVGRAIRNCSHINLDPKDRNVTVYHHVCTIPNRDNETIDQRIYRIAENKQYSINEVELLLKQNAIDCAINRNALYFDPSYLKMKLDIETSQGTVIKNFAVGDRGDKYNSYKCAFSPPATIQEDESTFNRAFYSDDIDLYASYISLLYTRGHSFTYEEIHRLLSSEFKLVDEDILKFTLEYMLNTRHIIYNSRKQEGYVIYRDKSYLFQPANVADTRMINRKRRLQLDKDVQKQIRIDGKIAGIDKKQVTGAQGMAATIKERVNATYTTELGMAEEQVKHLHQQMYDYVIDRLEEDSALALALEVMETETPDANTKAIQTSLLDAHILVKESTSSKSFKWVRNIYSTPEPTILVKRGDVLVQASPNELQKFNAAPMSSPKPNVEFKALKGFMEFGKDRKAKFKMIDSKKPKADGSVCATTATFYKEDLKKLIHAIEKKMPISDQSKGKLCSVYELLLRASTPKVFTRCFETQLVKASR